ncbi:hypothetical protein C8R44DRAFT_980609 [Mycena epipterygia]|nr:hypothetical protein C8R44DRAFT_980609 [Mycena epipterygia]
MSDNDCCSLFLSCCLCCSLCNHGSDSSAVRWFINLFPDSWCPQDGYAEEAAERDREAALFHGGNNTQPASTPGMDASAGGPNIRDKSNILAEPPASSRAMESKADGPNIRDKSNILAADSD